MADPRHVLFLAENFFNPIQFPLHVLTADQNPAEIFRVGTSRRSDQNTYDATVSGAIIDLALDRPRSADTLIMDRNTDTGDSNLSLRVSSDGGASYQELINGVEQPIPTAVVQGGSVDDPVHWIRTEEGANVLHFPEVAMNHFRIVVRATGGKLGGVYLGKSYRPTYPRLPFDDAGRWSEFPQIRRGVPGNDIRTGRAATVSMMMADEQEWDAARWQLRQLFGRGHPMWFIPNASRAERAWLSYNAGGMVSAPFAERPQGRSVSMNLEEYDPVLP